MRKEQGNLRAIRHFIRKLVARGELDAETAEAMLRVLRRLEHSLTVGRNKQVAKAIGDVARLLLRDELTRR